MINITELTKGFTRDQKYNVKELGQLEVAELKNTECWIANTVVNPAICEKLIQNARYRPVSIGGDCVISVHVAIVRDFEQPVYLCYLRILCEDLVTGKEFVWANNMRTNKNLAGLNMNFLGKIQVGLEVDLGRDFYGHRHLEVLDTDNRLDLRLVEYPNAQRAKTRVFKESGLFENYYFRTTCHQLVGAEIPKHCHINFINKAFVEPMNRYFGFLRTPWGNWMVDSVYRMPAGLLTIEEQT